MCALFSMKGFSMLQVKQHGVTFTLFSDPDDKPWVEIRRDRDGLIFVSAPFTGLESEFDESVEEWLVDFVEETLDSADFESCRSCGSLRPASDHSAYCQLVALQRIQYHFDLCTSCADHLVRTNPWMIKFYEPRDHDDVE